MKKTILYICLLFGIGLQAQNFWTEVSPFPSQGVDFYPSQISIVDENVLWVNGYNYYNPTSGTQKWCNTTDGGQTWNTGDINLGNPNLYVGAVDGISSSKAYVTVCPYTSGAYGGVWITQDSGTSWTKQTTALFSSPGSSPNFIHFWDANNGVVGGNPENGFFEIYTTSDGGTNWIRVPTQNIPALLPGESGYLRLYEIRGDSVWFGTTKGRLFKSYDRGNNWIVYQSPAPNYPNQFTFGFKNQTEGILASDAGWWNTSDGGITWTDGWLNDTIGCNDYISVQIVYVPGTAAAYFAFGVESCDNLRGSCYTTNNGNLWNSLEDYGTQQVMPTAAAFINDSLGFCVGRYIANHTTYSGLKFFKLTDTLHRILKTNTYTANPEISVIPNPTNGILKLSGENISEVLISDVLGKTISIQNYSSLQEVSVNMASYQNGIYLLKITNADGNSTIKKIIKN